jgi:hypothetical protein
MVHSFSATSVVSYRRIGTSAFDPVVFTRTSLGDPRAWMVPTISVCTKLISSARFVPVPGWLHKARFASSSRRRNWSYELHVEDWLRSATLRDSPALTRTCATSSAGSRPVRVSMSIVV